jgi:hypothetical protein
MAIPASNGLKLVRRKGLHAIVFLDLIKGYSKAIEKVYYSKI